MPRFPIIALICIALVTGCSSTRLAYQYADWGIIWWVEDYIPMTSEQERRLEQDVLALREWHCSTQLPSYSEWLSELRADVRSGNLSLATVTHHQEQLFSFFLPLSDRAKPAAVRLLSSLNDKQVEALAANMAESQVELEEEFLAENPEQTRRARAERTEERVERWLGSLNESQQSIVEKWSDDRGRQTEIWLEGRRNWQQALLEALDERQQPNFADRISHLIDNNEKVRGARYQQMMAESRPAMANLMAELLQVADSQQFNYLVDRATSLQGDFDSLSCA